MEEVFVKKIVIGACLVLAFSMSAFSQGARQQNTDKSCQEFVGKFYKWYVGMALKHNRLTEPRSVVNSRPYLFSPDLLRELKENYQAQDKAGSNLVSLDGDPFVGGDGPPDRYIAGKITRKDGRCQIELHGIREGKKSETPDVTPELVFRKGHWVFANFYFPSPSDTKAWNVLEGLRRIREEEDKNTSKNHDNL